LYMEGIEKLTKK